MLCSRTGLDSPINTPPCAEDTGYSAWYNPSVKHVLTLILIPFMPRALNPALTKPMTLSPELEAVVGKGPMPRSEVVKQIWVYIKKHDLQNPANKRNILADDKLKAVFGGKGEVTMFEMTKLVSAHLS
jgi:chromatin remodeling complex protein RSC6